MRPYVLTAVQQLKDWPGPNRHMSGDRAAALWWQAKVTGGYRKSDPACPTCFVKLSKTGECNC